jgi:hypothetical protein
MRILRSKGTSFTRLEDRKEKGSSKGGSDAGGGEVEISAQSRLSRGVRLHKDHESKAGPSSRNIWKGSHLADEFERDPDIELRHYVQWLDKALRKPRRLRHMDVPSYVARTFLGECLWDRYVARRGASDRPLGVQDLKRYRDRWEAKVHPYAQHEVKWLAPTTDANAEDIKKHGTEAGGKNRPASFTLWSEVFQIPFGALSKIDYEPSAEAIENHLREQEVKINKEPRQRNLKPSFYGLIQDRGFVLSRTASDPRETDAQERFRTWHDEAEETYRSAGDVAVTIVREFESNPRNENPKKKVGRLLYDHFGRLKPRESEARSQPQEVWNLHNAVRLYYRRTVEGTRFLEALRSSDTRKIRDLLPASMDNLYSRLEGAETSSEISRLIRLGKIVAHSIELSMRGEARAGTAEEGARLDPLIRAAMNYYVTSVGQADIKRNEAFVRVLRTSVAFGLRTLAAWMKPGLDKLATNPDTSDDVQVDALVNRDVSEQKVGAAAIHLLDVDRVRTFGRIVFGTRPHPVGAPTDAVEGLPATAAKSRTDILFQGDESDREVLWALLRLASRVRGKSYHFNTKAGLLDLVTKGMLQPLGPNGERDKSKRDGSVVEKYALDRLGQLLDYDLDLDAILLATELNRLDFALHVPGDRRSGALQILARVPASDDRVTPKFMRVLTKANSLATFDDAAGVPKELMSFRDLRLRDLSKDHNSANNSVIGILRLLYNRAFPDWLEQKENDEGVARTLLASLIEAKKKRREKFDADTRRVYSSDETFVETVLVNARTLREIESLLQRETGGGNQRIDPDRLVEDERLAVSLAGTDRSGDKPASPKNPYVPDRQLQADAAGALESVRCEIYAVLFAHFLQDKNMGWIWSITKQAPTEEEQPASVQASELATERRNHPDWLRQFYAWLYTVPVDQVALLRHQFRKTLILERKGDEDRRDILWSQKPTGDMRDVLLLLGAEPGKAPGADTGARMGRPQSSTERSEQFLREIDRVMGLYTRVQAAGFSGDETGDYHRFYLDPALAPDASGDELLENVFLPGTLAGLRHLERLDTGRVLEKTFQKHRVTPQETTVLRRVLQQEDTSIFEEKQRLHASIAAMIKEKPLREEQISTEARRYRDVSVEVAKHNFAISGARLADFANVNNLLVELLARLTDFTALWERDRDCVLLALCFQAHPKLRFAQSKGGVTLTGSGEFTPVEVFSRNQGFDGMHRKSGIAALAHLDAKPWANRFFALHAGNQPARAHHRKDEAWRIKKMSQPSKTGVPPIKRNIGHLFSVQQIRNDLAHFNVLDLAPDKSKPGKKTNQTSMNLTYLINAVRGLLSYDRKLKNTVPKAVADIMQRHGIAISWRFARDRLCAAELRPNLLRHLDFLDRKALRSKEGSDKLSFLMPRVSPRQLSMTRALFDFGHSGYVEDLEGIPGGKRLGYPMGFVEEMSALGVPNADFDIVYSGSEKPKMLKGLS